MLVLLASSCSSGANVDKDSAAAAASKPKSVPVEMQPDAATAATTSIGGDGGTVAATAADGTEYALQVPAGALPGAVDITMTPLAGMTGLPKGAELAFGVSLEPQGLLFAKPSWLYVTSKAMPDDIFSGLGVNDDVATLRGIGYDGARFILSVAHFSGTGGVGCPGCGRGGWPGLPGPGSPPAPGSPGGGPITPPGPGVPPYDPPGTPPGPFPPGPGDPHGGDSLTGDYDPTTGLNGTGDLKGDIGDALGDLADAQLSGDEEAEKKAQGRLDKLKEKVKDEVWKSAEACVNEKDITKLKDLIYWETMGQLLGYEKDDAESAKLTSLIAACNRFEMVSEGKLLANLGDIIKIGDSITLTVPLDMDGPAYTGSATSTVKPVGYDRGGEILDLFAQGLGAFMGVDVPNDITENTYESCTTAPGTGTVTALATNLLADVGPTVNVALAKASDATVSCGEPIGSFPIEPFITMGEMYSETGFPGATESGIVFDKWTVTGDGAPFATKDVHHEMSEDGATITIDWHLVINHAPGKLPPR